MPFHVFVPSRSAAGVAAPLVIALHGCCNGTEDRFFQPFDGVGTQLPSLLEQRGFLFAAPWDYRVDGGYGFGVNPPPADPEVRRVRELSELDVMEVVRWMREHYNVDPARIYLMGHSVGGVGTWRLAAKYPDLWAGVASIAGTGVPATVERFKQIPEFVVHGDADTTNSVEHSREMVTKMRELGVDVTYVEVPGGGHQDVVPKYLPAILDFMKGHRKSPSP